MESQLLCHLFGVYQEVFCLTQAIFLKDTYYYRNSFRKFIIGSHSRFVIFVESLYYCNGAWANCLFLKDVALNFAWRLVGYIE